MRIADMFGEDFLIEKTSSLSIMLDWKLEDRVHTFLHGTIVDKMFIFRWIVMGATLKLLP